MSGIDLSTPRLQGGNAMKLNFVEHLLAHGRQLHRLGQAPAATRVLQRVIGLRDLPADVVEDTHRELAELHLEQGKYRLARRALAAALAQQPAEPHYHFLMGVAVLDDPQGQPRRALAHLRTALRLDPDNAEYNLEFALLALSLDKSRAALAALRRAAQLAPDNPEVLGRVADGLRNAGRHDEARALLRAALFRHARDRRFRELWNRHQFEMLHAAQQEQRTRWTPSAQKPVILKFVRPRKSAKIGEQIVRADGPETTGPKLLGTRPTPRKKAR
jgi:tetratricopeptide (TPR) repeat protein